MSNNRFLAKEIAQILLEKQAVKISTDPPFTWTSGMKSPIYCDNRLLISYPEERKKILEGFKNLIAENNLEFDVIGGTATAAIPWAAFLAFDLDKPMVYIRPKPKGHGAGRRVEGTMEKGSRVLIVEDLISTGGSSILIDLFVAPGDIGRVIGRKGRHINAMRTLARVLGAKMGKRVSLEIADDGPLQSNSPETSF